MSIALERITKRFGSYAALDEVSLTVRSGELVALLGPSGSGKTTLLRIIAGLEQPDAGDIRLNGEIATARSPRDREVGFVFQHYALFRHMTIFENVAFGLRVRPRGHRPPNAEIRERVQALLKLVQIERLAGRMPSQLSGGQRQRVALARALAIEPRVLLLDEPFGALDAKVRKELRRWLRGLHQEMRITSVFVTHDQEEALEVADRVVVMGQGRIEQAGAPEVVYNRPGNPFVYRFLGGANEIAAEVHHGAAYAPGVSIGAVTGNLSDGKATLYVRPHDIELTPDPAALARIRFAAAVGPIARIEVEVDPAAPPLEVEMPYDEFRGAGLSTGARVRVRARQAQTFQAPLA